MQYHYQPVLIRSDPPGATVLVDGEVRGQTPSYVQFHRSLQPSVALLSDGDVTQIPLHTSYRWHDSFFGDLIFLTYAPIGWALDLLTGTAWTVRDSPVIVLAHSNPRKRLLSRGSYAGGVNLAAIAPPLADSLELSDAGGQALEAALQENRFGPHVLGYGDTLQDFVSHGFDYDGWPDPIDRRRMYYLLQKRPHPVTSVYESKIEKRGDDLILTTRPFDTLEAAYGPSTELVFEPDDKTDAIYSGPKEWLHILPNTFTIESVNETMKWSVSNEQGNTRTVKLGPRHGQDGWNQFLNLISAFNISSLPARRIGRASRFQFSFVPTLHLSRRLLQAEGDPYIHDTEFDRLWVSGGYGIEVGWQKSRHYVYLNLIPQLYWDQLQWHSSEGSFSRTGKGLTFQSEIGYLYFFSQHWNVSAFSRTFNEDRVTWGRALSSASGQADYGTGNLSRAVYGVSIGYRFDPKYNLGHWGRKVHPIMISEAQLR